MDHRVPLERKLALAQYIREENHGNRMKIRQRENILYGTNAQPPLYDRGKLPPGEQGYGNPAQEDGIVPVFSMGTFKYRMILAILLFVGFLLCDTGSGRVGRYTTGDIHEMIMADTFHLYDTDGNDTMDGLAELFGSRNNSQSSSLGR